MLEREPTLKRALMSDTYRQFGRAGWGLLTRAYLGRPSFLCIVTLRVCKALSASAFGRLLLPLARLLHHSACRRAGVDLSWRTEVGPGFKVTHGWGTVVNPLARIGRNVTLFHGVTLGRRDHLGDDGNTRSAYPKLEDQVWCGPHAVIVGGITIGAGSRIAAGAFVTEDIPPGSVVVGNPAVIVKSGCHPSGQHLAPF